jgi:hypothetical protein
MVAGARQSDSAATPSTRDLALLHATGASEQAQRLAAVLGEKGAEIHPPASLSRPVIEIPVSVAACGYPNSLEALQGDRYFARMADSLQLTAKQLAELEAIRMLTDPRFTPHLSAEEFSQSVRAVLTDPQADRLITFLWKHAAE